MDQPPASPCQPRRAIAWCLALMLLAVLPCRAQQAPADTQPPPDSATAQAASHALKVEPRLGLSETFSDNANHATGAGARADQITEVSPGLHLSRESGRVSGYLDYALRFLRYAQGSQPGQLLHALASVVHAQAVDEWLLLDFEGNMAQQPVSAFGLLPLGSNGGTAGSSEWSHFSLAPSVQGTLGSQLAYSARLRRSITHSNSALASDVGETLGSVNLGSSAALGRLGWLLEASRYDVDYSAGRATEADLLQAGLSYAITPQLQGFVKAGTENSNYTSLDKRSHATSDIGLNWQASRSWHASASLGQRSFGTTHAADLEYRSPRWLLRLGDRRDVSAVPGQVLPVLLVPLPGLAPVPGSFVTTAVSIQNRQDLQMTYLGQRDTLSLLASTSQTSRLDTLAPGFDVLASDNLRQQAFSLGYRHRLTPRHTLDLQAAWQRASGAATPPDSALHELSLVLGWQLRHSAHAFAGLRRAEFNGSGPYTENALSLGLVAAF